MKPDQRARNIVDQAMLPLAIYNSGQADRLRIDITDALTAATRAAYERGLKDGYDAGFAGSGEGWNGEYPHDPPAAETDAYSRHRDFAVRAIIDKEST